MVKRSISFLIFVVFVWLIWSYSGRNLPLTEAQSFLSVTEEINSSDSLTRNIIGIQPYMELSDYLNPGIFENKIRLYIAASRQKGFIRKNTVILFPENLGTYLFLLGEKHAVAEKETWEEAKNTMIFSNLFDYFLGYIKTGEESNKAKSAIFRMKSKTMATVYYDTFSKLAKETQSYIFAGSIILPGPYVSDGEIYTERKKALANVSFLFGPDGKIVGQPIYKTHPNKTELGYLIEPEFKTVQNSPLHFANVSLLIGKDSWFPENQDKALVNNTDLLLMPASAIGENSMNSIWTAKDFTAIPPFIEEGDLNQISLKEAWAKYSLFQHLAAFPLKVGASVFLNGNFWENSSEVQPIIFYNGEFLTLSSAENAGIWTLNF